MGSTTSLARTYGVELLFPERPILDFVRMASQLQERDAGIEVVQGATPGSNGLTIAHRDHLVSYDDGTMPAQAMIALATEPAKTSERDRALEQTWDWDEARDAVTGCSWSVLVTDFLASGFEYHTRLKLFHTILEGVLTAVTPKAILWHPSQRIVNPATYVATRRRANPDPLGPAINVRLFRVEGRAPGEMVMDTLGLAALGLPDLQCHFLDLEPGAVAGILYSTAEYLFMHGDIIEDGHTIQGLTVEQHWRCQHEDSLVPPARTIVDIDPGIPYVAGQRS